MLNSAKKPNAQRFSDALNLHLHFHTLVLDGVYEGEPESPDADRFGAEAASLDGRCAEAELDPSQCTTRFAGTAVTQLRCRER